MKRDKGLISTTIIKSDIKRLWWASTIYFLSVVFLVVLPLTKKGVVRDLSLMFSDQSSRYSYILYNLYAKLLYITIAAGIVFSIVIFHFMNRKKKSEFVFSLPIKRSGVFFSKCISAFCLYCIPFILFSMIAFSQFYLRRSEVVIDNGGTVFLRIMGFVFLCGMLAFFTTTAIGMFTSSSIATGIFTSVFMLIPLAMEYMIVYTRNVWILGNVKGYDFDVQLVNFFLRKLQPILSPDVVNLYYSFDDVAMRIESELVWNVLICTTVYAAIAFIMFKFRKNESVGNTIIFKWFRPILKYGFTLSVMMVTLFFFCRDYYLKSFGFKISIYMISGALAYFVAIWFLEKSALGVFKKKNFMGMCVYLVMVFLICFGVEKNIFDVQGFGLIKDKITSVEVSMAARDGETKAMFSFNYKEEENREKVFALSKEAIKYAKDNFKKLGREWYMDGYIDINAYEGDKELRKRGYPLGLTEPVGVLMKELYESDERINFYKENIRSEDISDIEYRVNHDGVTINDRKIFNEEEIKAIVKAYKLDFEEVSFEEVSKSKNIMEISLRGKNVLFNDRISFGIEINSCDKNLIRVMKSIGIYEKLYPELSSIQEIHIRDGRRGGDWVKVEDGNTKEFLHNIVVKRSERVKSDQFERIEFKFTMKDDEIIEGYVQDIIYTEELKKYLNIDQY